MTTRFLKWKFAFKSWKSLSLFWLLGNQGLWRRRAGLWQRQRGRGAGQRLRLRPLPTVPGASAGECWRGRDGQGLGGDQRGPAGRGYGDERLNATIAMTTTPCPSQPPPHPQPHHYPTLNYWTCRLACSLLKYPTLALLGIFRASDLCLPSIQREVTILFCCIWLVSYLIACSKRFVFVYLRMNLKRLW